MTSIQKLFNGMFIPNKDVQQQFETFQKSKDLYREEIKRAFLEGMRCSAFDPNEGRAELYFKEVWENSEK